MNSAKWACRLLLFLWAIPAFAQYNLVPIPLTFEPANGNPTFGANLTITFCTSTATGTLCSPLAQASSFGGPINHRTNPLTMDSLGNAPTFYAAPGQYSYTVTGPGLTSSQGPYQITVSCMLAGSTCASMSTYNTWSAAQSFSTLNKLNKVIFVDQQSGSTADAKFANACSALPSTGGTLDARGFGSGSYTLSTASTAFSCGSSSEPVTILFDPSTTFIPGSATQTVIAVNPNNVVDGLTVNTTSLNYSGTMVTFPGTCSDSMRCVFRNFLLSNGTGSSGVTTGTAILLQALSGVNGLYWVDVEHGRITGFQNGIYVTATGPIGSFYAANSNNFYDVEVKNAVNCWVYKSNPGDITGNVAVNSFCQYGPQSAVGVSISGTSGSNTTANQFLNFNIWDYASGTTIYTFDANTTKTWAQGLGWLSGGGTTSDSGKNNNVFDPANNAFGNDWAWKISGALSLITSSNVNSLKIGYFPSGTRDTQWAFQPHAVATGDFCATLVSVATEWCANSSGLYPYTASRYNLGSSTNPWNYAYLNGVISKGTNSVSGCSLTNAVGGATAGSFKSGTSGTCTVTITLPTAPNGWTCDAHDITSSADANNMVQTDYTRTSCTISGTTASADVITWKAQGW